MFSELAHIKRKCIYAHNNLECTRKVFSFQYVRENTSAWLMGFICLKILYCKEQTPQHHSNPLTFSVFVCICLFIHTICILVVVLITPCIYLKLTLRSTSSGLWKAVSVFPHSIFLFVQSQPPTVSKGMC